MIFRRTAIIVAITTGDLPKMIVISGGNWLMEDEACAIPTPRAADSPTMVVFLAESLADVISFIPVMAIVEKTVTVAPPSTHCGMVVSTAENLGQMPAASRSSAVSVNTNRLMTLLVIMAWLRLPPTWPAAVPTSS